MAASLFQARSTKPSGRGMLWRQMASFLTSLVTCQTLLAAGRKIGHVARTEPAAFTFFVGDENFAGYDVQDFVDHVMPMETAGRARPGDDRRIPSGLVASRFERACGVPSMIQSAGSGAGSSSSIGGNGKNDGMRHEILRDITSGH